MSGTSVDGIDLALIDDEPLSLLASDFVPFQPSLRTRLLDVIQGGRLSAMDLARLDADLAQAYCQAISTFLNHHPNHKVKAIGLHGQTVAHLPQHTPANSWQIGHPAWVAAQTGIPVISDFRRMDMALGGQGAPLAPALHQALFKQTNKTIGVLNLGGIANLTLINEQLIGFDVGPANCLLDEWCHRHTGQGYDDNGDWAQSGQVHEALLQSLLSDDYFHQPSPKSTGREYFNQSWLKKHLESFSLSAADVQRTLVALVAVSVQQALNHHAGVPDQLIVVGGGVHNTLIMRCLQQSLDCPVVSSHHYGIPPDDIEAMLMAWLAARHMRGERTDLCAVTGCRSAHIYGIRFDA